MTQGDDPNIRGWHAPGFQIRATALVLNEDRILVHAIDRDPVSVWALPGGGPQFLEFSEEAVVREMREELGVEAVVDRLVFVIEHTFKRPLDGRPSHCIEFVHLVEIDDPEIRAKQEPWIAPGVESYGKLLYHWLPLDRLVGNASLYPACLRALVVAPMPETPVHISARETDQ
jgi:ADP-ribose pyrophosphatase YjhB (NUDIX family)